jgi:hypothetical protein
MEATRTARRGLRRHERQLLTEQSKEVDAFFRFSLVGFSRVKPLAWSRQPDVRWRTGSLVRATSSGVFWSLNFSLQLDDWLQ